MFSAPQIRQFCLIYPFNWKHILSLTDYFLRYIINFLVLLVVFWYQLNRINNQILINFENLIYCASLNVSCEQLWIDRVMLISTLLVIMLISTLSLMVVIFPTDWLKRMPRRFNLYVIECIINWNVYTLKLIIHLWTVDQKF